MFKKVGSQFLAVILVIISTIIVGIILNLLGAMVPVEWIHANIQASTETLQVEGPFYPTIGYRYKNSIADNNTDAVMLLMADYESEESVLRRSVEGVIIVPEKIINTGSNYYDFFVSYMNGSPQVSAWNYSRYWCGWMLPLKILLIFFQYEDIRFLGQAVQLLLLILLLLQIFRRNKYLAVAFLSIVMLMNPSVLAVSFEYAFCYYVILIHGILLVSRYETWEKPIAFCTFFATTGAITSYFDFLTYPIATLGVCMVLYIGLAQAGRKGLISDVVKGSVCWGAGYGLTWGFKWLLCRWVLGREYLELALNQVKLRASSTAGIGKIDPDAPITFVQALRNNFEVFDAKGYWFVGGAAVAGLVIWVLSKEAQRKSFSLNLLGAYFLCFCMPFAWTFCLKNHTYIHRNFTSNMFVICLFALEAFVIKLADGN